MTEEENAARDLFEAAKAVSKNAYAPHSGLLVGAAVRGKSGRVYVGANVENASYPEGWCAETSALAQMVAAGETALSAVCVVADFDPPISPCGGCRQRLAEFGTADVLVHSGDQNGIRARWLLGDLLPHAFDLETGG